VASLLQHPGLRGVYIASPPDTHMPLSEQALAAGLAVLCEKPLAVDEPSARRCMDRIEQGKHRAAVNFPLASSGGLAQLQALFGKASPRPLGELQSVHLSMRFAAWPRPWQRDAGAWLSERASGGFSREVLSHFIFVLQRVLGPARVVRSSVTYPDLATACEQRLSAQLDAQGVRVDIDAAIEGSQDDVNEMRWLAQGGELRLSHWFSRARLRSQQEWRDLGEVELRTGQARSDNLEHWLAMLDGHSHALPSFAEALAVQQTIEALLQATPASCS